LTPRAKYPKNFDYLKTFVKEGASLGANSTIVCGSVIGKWALVGAGAVVVGDVPDYALTLGVPAKRIGWICECGTPLNGKLVCEKCARKYELQRGVLFMKSNENLYNDTRSNPQTRGPKIFGGGA
jgi:UDP-2-acetamido-3-amino-2,3-dideoxy-glucuronate N-acetyltransferase